MVLPSDAQQLLSILLPLKSALSASDGWRVLPGQLLGQMKSDIYLGLKLDSLVNEAQRFEKHRTILDIALSSFVPQSVADLTVNGSLFVIRDQKMHVFPSSLAPSCTYRSGVFDLDSVT